MYVFRGFLLVLAIGMLTGCATIMRGTTQTIALDTPGAPGAQCTLTSSSVGTKVVKTPASITVDKGSDNINVRCTRKCFEPGVGVIASNVEGMTAGNVILGGVVGLGVDAATGAMNKYNSNNQIVMTHIPGCRA